MPFSALAISSMQRDGHLEEGGVAGEGGDSGLLLIDELGERARGGDMGGPRRGGGRGTVGTLEDSTGGTYS